MKTRVTTLCESTAGVGDVLAEIGWSVLVETDEKKILLDTGRTISVVHNADVLGIDLQGVDKIVLSHSHYNHTGGLRQVLKKMKKDIEIIAHPHVWATRYNRRNEEHRYMGIPFARQELENFGAIFQLSSEPQEITENTMTTGEIPMMTEFEDLALPLFGGTARVIQEGTNLRPDEILDDLALVIKSQEGLIVILGCCHRGIINTLNHAQKITGEDRIHAVIGGAHLMNVTPERLEQTVAKLKEFDVQRLGLCHCTGIQSMLLLAKEFGDKFFFNYAGMSVEFP